MYFEWSVDFIYYKKPQPEGNALMKYKNIWKIDFPEWDGTTKRGKPKVLQFGVTS